ncbi:hypothetical protein B0H12DRAFT_1225301 [Mycena haematopus]|nr:hypothetical protein B0H12DRAFT_1225301 [Mycena haematopus]
MSAEIRDFSPHQDPGNLNSGSFLGILNKTSIFCALYKPSSFRDSQAGFEPNSVTELTSNGSTALSADHLFVMSHGRLNLSPPTSPELFEVVIGELDGGPEGLSASLVLRRTLRSGFDGSLARMTPVARNQFRTTSSSAGHLTNGSHLGAPVPSCLAQSSARLFCLPWTTELDHPELLVPTQASGSCRTSRNIQRWTMFDGREDRKGLKLTSSANPHLDDAKISPHLLAQGVLRIQGTEGGMHCAYKRVGGEPTNIFKFKPIDELFNGIEVVEFVSSTIVKICIDIRPDFSESFNRRKCEGKPVIVFPALKLGDMHVSGFANQTPSRHESDIGFIRACIQCNTRVPVSIHVGAPPHKKTRLDEGKGGREAVVRRKYIHTQAGRAERQLETGTGTKARREAGGRGGASTQDTNAGQRVRRLFLFPGPLWGPDDGDTTPGNDTQPRRSLRLKSESRGSGMGPFVPTLPFHVTSSPFLPHPPHPHRIPAKTPALPFSPPDARPPLLPTRLKLPHFTRHALKEERQRPGRSNLVHMRGSPGGRLCGSSMHASPIPSPGTASPNAVPPVRGRLAQRPLVQRRPDQYSVVSPGVGRLRPLRARRPYVLAYARVALAPYVHRDVSGAAYIVLAIFVVVIIGIVAFVGVRKGGAADDEDVKRGGRGAAPRTSSSRATALQTRDEGSSTRARAQGPGTKRGEAQGRKRAEARRDGNGREERRIEDRRTRERRGEVRQGEEATRGATRGEGSGWAQGRKGSESPGTGTEARKERRVDARRGETTGNATRYEKRGEARRASRRQPKPRHGSEAKRDSGRVWMRGDGVEGEGSGSAEQARHERTRTNARWAETRCNGQGHAYGGGA